jgi:quercetin dioxygenase-like cupin family protein
MKKEESMNALRNWFWTFVVTGAVLCTTSLCVAQTAAPDKGQVAQFDAAKVMASFEKAGVLVPFTPDHNYSVLTARREKPGQSELHTKDTDIVYVVEGTATFVTGGEVVDGKTTAPDEVRGESIKDGTPHKLAKGDVIIVPNNTPHQFVEVSNPFLYFVVKVR